MEADLNIAFSIIIPVYNSPQYLYACIDSLCKASAYLDMNTEILLIDDGSADTSGVLCDTLIYRSTDKLQIKVIHKPNGGVSGARNTGLDLARGAYVIFIDSDDTVDSALLGFCMKTIADNKQVDMLVYGISFDYYKAERCYRRDRLLPPFSGEKTYSECMDAIKCLFDTNSLSSLCTRIIKRNTIKDLRLCASLILYEDLEFSLRILRECRSLFFVQESVYHYRQSYGHNDNRLKRIENITVITDKISDALTPLNCDKRYILDSLSSYLNNGKINTMTLSELKKKYHGKAYRIYTKRLYRKTRHRIAEFIKSRIGDYRKWKI